MNLLQRTFYRLQKTSSYSLQWKIARLRNSGGTTGRLDGSVGSVYTQACWHEFNSQISQGNRREPTLWLWCVCALGSIICSIEPSALGGRSSRWTSTSFQSHGSQPVDGDSCRTLGHRAGESACPLYMPTLMDYSLLLEKEVHSSRCFMLKYV